jgi:hypothetical protein
LKQSEKLGGAGGVNLADTRTEGLAFSDFGFPRTAVE